MVARIASSSSAGWTGSRHPAVVSGAPGAFHTAAQIIVFGLALCAAGTAAIGCAAPAPRPTPTAATTITRCGGLAIEVRGARAADTEVAAVAAAIAPACAALARRGLAPSTAPVVVIHDTVDAFVGATGQTGDTLRAWSTPDTVHLLTLEAWRAVDDDAVVRRLTHELCHVGIFQRAGDGARRLPRALGEGMCSVAAGQGVERMPLHEVRRRVAAGEPVDFVGDSPFAYGVAHHVVAGIADCRGDDALQTLIDDVAAGQAVVEALGAPPLSFLDACPTGSGPSSAGVESPQ